MTGPARRIDVDRVVVRGGSLDRAAAGELPRLIGEAIRTGRAPTTGRTAGRTADAVAAAVARRVAGDTEAAT